MTLRWLEPPDGWLKLAWEVGVVVVGVLIALGAQQFADNLSWEGKATQAKRSIENELMQHERDAYERRAVTPCLKRQLKLLADRLERDRGRWIGLQMVVHPTGLPTVADKVTPTAYRAPTRLWIDEAFKTAQSTGALNHLPDALVADYSGIYRRSRRNIEIQDVEEAAANQLSALAVNGELSNGERLQLFGALARVDYAASYLEANLIAEIPMIDRVLKHVPLERRRKNVEEAIAIQRKFRGQCVLPLTPTY